MSGWPLKEQARVAGVDDGPYRRGSESTLVIITISRLDGYIEGMLSCNVSTDGDDSSRRISETILKSRFKDQIRAILSDGACLAGFNVLDLRDIYERTGIPIITCSDESPHGTSILKALKGNFTDWQSRYELIERYTPIRIDLPDGPCFIRCEGITPDRGAWIVRKVTLRGRTPEPVRLSHIAAGSVSNPEGDVNG